MSDGLIKNQLHRHTGVSTRKHRGKWLLLFSGVLFQDGKILGVRRHSPRGETFIARHQFGQSGIRAERALREHRFGKAETSFATAAINPIAKRLRQPTARNVVSRPLRLNAGLLVRFDGRPDRKRNPGAAVVVWAVVVWAVGSWEVELLLEANLRVGFEKRPHCMPI